MIETLTRMKMILHLFSLKKMTNTNYFMPPNYVFGYMQIFLNSFSIYP